MDPIRSGRKQRVLFLCTGNSCRSQMAEGWARHLLGEHVEAYSAGLEAHGLNPRAVQVMAESGVSIAEQRSKRLAELEGIDFDLVVTVCADADARCPVFPGATPRIHRGFDDPPRLAAQAHDEPEALEHFRRVRDEIRAFVQTLPSRLAAARKSSAFPADTNPI